MHHRFTTDDTPLSELNVVCTIWVASQGKSDSISYYNVGHEPQKMGEIPTTIWEEAESKKKGDGGGSSHFVVIRLKMQ